jgi:transposase-like protein
MPPVDRNNPVRAKASESQLSLMEFMREFPDDATCLEHLWRERYAPDGHTAHCPSCNRDRRFHRVKGRPAYDCDTCGHHLHPLAGTIFHKSSTSLQLWFYAIWLMTSTRCGISAKQLERELGVTYKTAWRMFNRIRNQLMEQGDHMLSGEVEVDETFIKGRMRQSERVQRAKDGVNPKNHHRPGTAIVYGAVERGGRIRATTIPDSRARTLLGQTHEYVLPGSLIYTDEWAPYMRLGKLGYTHRRIRHRSRIYVDGETHTQTIDGFFGMLKDAIRGVHHGVSEKWLQGYLNEYAYRWNHRDDPRAMFWLLLHRAVQPVES